MTSKKSEMQKIRIIRCFNTRSEVIGAQRYHGTDVSDTSRVYGGRGFGYAFDPIGNRTTATETIGGETLAKSYTANALNQYTAIANPDAVGLRGSATNTATVSVNGSAALSDNVTSTVRPWHYALQADNADGGKYTFASIVGVVNPPGTNTPDIVSTASGSVYAPPQAEALAYDDDGNLLADGRWEYTWNGENRLIKAEEQVCPTNRTLRKVDYAYDHQGRMVWKKISRRGAQSWEEEKKTSYLWDRFNIIAETTAAGSATNISYNVWGLDINGSMQGAGGVGGLLAVVKNSATYIPAWDANGNIMEYVAEDGTIVVHREYDPFGGTVIVTGNADAFTHWFSTKLWCPVTSLSEYQYRKYSPVMGRWLSRDPIEERGGVNLLAFAWNSSIVYFDVLGLETSSPQTPAEENCKACCRVYIAFHYDPDPSTFHALEDRIANNAALLRRMKKDLLSDSTLSSRVFYLTIKNVGKGGELLQAQLQEVAKKPPCDQGLSVIIYGHGDANRGLLYPIQAHGDFIPEYTTTYPGDEYMPSPTRPMPPGLGGTKWPDIWANVKTMHVKACYSSKDKKEFSGQYFTGYTGAYDFGTGQGNPVTSAPIPPSPKPRR
jgi:RHS repeat-associated protein